MKIILQSVAAVVLVVSAATFLSSYTPKATQDTETKNPKPKKQKIQVAILLDVSNSMDGLIEQAKAQLWNMVSVMGKAETDDKQTPDIEIALYEYGRTSNEVSKGYIKQITPFTTDLDMLSQNLFKLTTYGGAEYCTNVMYTSLNELNWDNTSSSYKVIFIAGNEDFLQGDVSYTKACELAKSKGVIVNTIYCGDKMQGIKEHWNLTGCGNGSYTNINQDAKIDDIPTPYDSLLITLNDKLNSTYIAYGSQGMSKLAAQAEVDQKSFESNKAAAIKRAGVKGNSKLYRNSSWDLIDAVDDDSSFLAKVDLSTIPSSLQIKSRAQLIKLVNEKKTERGNIQKEIAKLTIKRETFIASEKARAANTKTEATLETEIEKTIRKQARDFNIKIN
jgi:hypothetical protein